VVADNVFHQIGLDYVGSVGLCVDGGRCRIRGNEIRGVPYVGIAAGGKNGRIENNVVREYMQDGEDGGAYYVYGKTRNYLVRGNAAYGPPGRAMAHAYYTDEFSADHRIEGNLAVNARWPLHTHISSGHRIVNNVFVDRGPSKITLTRSHGMRFERNIICAGGSITIHMRPDGISAMPNNIFFCRRGTLRVGWLAKQEYHTLKTEAFPLRDGSILADPLFTDASRGEYSFKRRSPAHDLGIRPIGVSPQITN